MHLKENSCCFTGHRPMKLPWGMNEADARCLELKAELAARLEAAYELGYRHFICGMATGCDMYFAEAVIALRALLSLLIHFEMKHGHYETEEKCGEK